jgi:hypothetical protein
LLSVPTTDLVGIRFFLGKDEVVRAVLYLDHASLRNESEL